MNKINLILFLFIGILVFQALSFAHDSAIGKKLQAIEEGHALPVSENLQQRIDPRILSEDSEFVDVIIKTENDEGIEKSLFPSAKKFDMGNFYSMKLSKSDISKLENDNSVKRVWLETEYKALLDVSVPLIQAAKFWNSGYNGSGIRVCVLDTGINKTHPALASRVIAEADFTGSSSGTADIYGHGTHVAGIVASTDLAYRGVAPGVFILNAKVLNDAGSGYDAWIMNGTDWCIAQGADILTMSLGGESPLGDGSDPLSQYVDLAVDKGKIVTIAAGNSGPTGYTECRNSRDTSGNSYSVCEPGLAHKAITVGSTQSGKTGPQDAISGFSSRGPTTDGRTKPDVTAPGERIKSTWKDGSFNTIWGTSMATPHVAGLSALILQARNMTPEEAKALLMNTAIDFSLPGKDNSYGAGRINASRVFDEINNTIRSTTGADYKAHSIFVPAGSKEIRATLYWPENYSSHNDLDLYLLDPAGNVRASSVSLYDTDEAVRLPYPYPFGNWKLLVDPVNATLQVYSIAGNFLLSNQVYLSIENISNTVVYHRINVTNNSVMKVSLDWNYTDANLDMYLYNTTGGLQNYSASVNTSHEEVSINNPENGTWIAKLLPYNLSNYTEIFYSITSSSPVSQQVMDITPPIITVVEPVNRTYNIQNISLALRIVEDMNAFVYCYRVTDNVTYLLGNVQNDSLASYNFSAQDGPHELYVTCADEANNWGNSSAVYFSVDSVTPSIFMQSPENATYNFNTLSLNFTVDEASIDKIWYNIDGGGSLTIDKNITFNVPEGSHTLYLFVNDTAGNLNSTFVTFSTDAIPPPIAITSPQNTTYNNAAVLINIPSDGSGIWYNWNGTNIIYTTPVYATFGEGPNTLYAYANDTAGNTNSTSVSFSVDTTQPVISIQSPKNSTFNFNMLKLNFTVDEASIDKIWYNIDNGENVAVIGNTTFDAPEGSHTLYIFANDTAGNVNSTSIGFSVDTTPIGLSFVSPTPNNLALLENNSIMVNVTTNEAPDSILLEWNGANETLYGNAVNWFKLKDNLTDGTYTFKVYLNDSAGNANVSETRQVFINATTLSAAGSNDTEAPSIIISSPLAAAYSSPTIQLTYIVTDNAAVDTCWYSLNTYPNATLDNCANTTITASEGSNTLAVYANDTSGNANQTTVTFTFSPSLPPPYTSPGGGSAYDYAAPRPNQTKTAQNFIGNNKTYNKTENVTTQSGINKTLSIPAIRNVTSITEINATNAATGFVVASEDNAALTGVAAVAVAFFLFWFVDRRSSKRKVKSRTKKYVYRARKRAKIKRK